MVSIAIKHYKEYISTYQPQSLMSISFILIYYNLILLEGKTKSTSEMK